MNTSTKEENAWKGIPLSELPLSFNKPMYPSVKPSLYHTVRIKLPVTGDNVPQPDPPADEANDVWDDAHVRLPCSPKNLYPVAEDTLKGRWELIKEALQAPILSSQQLETAILTYNSKYIDNWKFSALHEYFTKTIPEEECDRFFAHTLPGIIKLALSLPEYITGEIPLLKQHSSHSITLSQLQVASLLANAFLCTFPRRNTTKRKSEYRDFPDINFNRLFQGGSSRRCKAVQNKLRCIIHYFERVTTKVPKGVITYSRSSLRPSQLPNWSESPKVLKELHITSSGTIEDMGVGMLQMDFADKYIGGGVLRYGSVQEEIRFIICPELILSRLFTQCLAATEVLIITGCERYCLYKGYGASFEYNGPYEDTTPSDEYGRKHCTVIAADALRFTYNPSSQYLVANINRELNKAYAGFSWGEECLSNCSIATGNWGCGVFRGDVQLKALLQLMAAAEAGRMLAYFTFGNDETRDIIYRTYVFLKDNRTTVGELWNMLKDYSINNLYKKYKVSDFLYETVVHKSVPLQVAPKSSEALVVTESRHQAVAQPKPKMLGEYLSDKNIDEIIADLDQKLDNIEGEETATDYVLTDTSALKKGNDDDNGNHNASDNEKCVTKTKIGTCLDKERKRWETVGKIMKEMNGKSGSRNEEKQNIPILTVSMQVESRDISSRITEKANKTEDRPLETTEKLSEKKEAQKHEKSDGSTVSASAKAEPTKEIQDAQIAFGKDARDTNEITEPVDVKKFPVKRKITDFFSPSSKK